MGRKHSEGNRSAIWVGLRSTTRGGLVAVAAEPQAPKRKPGRPKAGEPAPEAPPPSRQQRRYQERMLAKAAKAWDAATDGKGVVLVDGEPVPVKGVKPAK